MMKKLLSLAAGAGIVALCLIPATTSHTSAQAAPTATAVATTTPTTVPTPAPTGPPIQGVKLSAMLYVDTVQGAGGSPKPAVGCSQTNLFQRGQVVVFRMWGVNVKAGGIALTSKTVTSATILGIPGATAPLQMTYGTHPSGTSFWSAPWFTKSDTPLGEVDFTVVVKTKAITINTAGKKTKIKAFTAKFTQQGLASPSRLQITP